MPSPTKEHEDNKSVVYTAQSCRITPRLRHVGTPLCYLNYEHRNGTFTTKSISSRIQFANMGTKSESGPHVMRSSSIAMGHVHLRKLPKDQHDALVSITPISCYNGFRRD